MKPEAVAQVQALVSPQSLELMAGMGTAWLASHAFGVGEAADLLLVVGGGLALGWSVFTLAEELFLFFEKALRATTDHDMDEAGDHFARAVAIGGVTLILSLIVKGAGKSLRNRVPRIAGTPPPGRGWFYKPTTMADPNLSPGVMGETTPYGDIRYKPNMSQADVEATVHHEGVHRFFSPRLRLFQELRADLSQHMYNNSVLLRYLEEGAAETYAQLRMNGLGGLMNGLTFPVRNPGYAITWVQLGRSASSVALGTITVSGTMYMVYLLTSYFEGR